MSSVQAGIAVCMKQGPETDMGGTDRAVPATLWTVVLKAKDQSSADRLSALGQLIQGYWKPAYLFIRRRGNDVEASKDIVQGFFTALMERNYLQYVDRGKGRFRTFLLTALQHYMADEFDRAKAQKRGGGRSAVSIDVAQAELDLPDGAVSGTTPEKVYHREWAMEVMGDAMQAVRADFDRASRLAEFETLKLYLTQARPECATYSGAAAALGLSEDEIRTRVRSLRARYREAILQVIRSYTDGEEEAREELRDLLSAFA